MLPSFGDVATAIGEEARCARAPAPRGARVGAMTSRVLSSRVGQQGKSSKAHTEPSGAATSAQGSINLRRTAVTLALKEPLELLWFH